MTNTIFDLIETELPSGTEGFMEVANNAPSPKDDSWLNTFKDYGEKFSEYYKNLHGAALKGTVEGLHKFGRMMGPLPTADRSDPTHAMTEKLNELIPTDEGFIGKSVRRGLNIAPSATGLPGIGAVSTLTRSGIAGVAGESAKELGLPKLAQDAAEFTAFVGPDITKKLLESGKNSDLITFAKKMGMTDEQITPLIQSEFKQNWLSKLVKKEGGTEKALKSTHEALGNVYQTVQNSEEAAKVLSGEAKETLISAIESKLKDLPSASRDLIKQDLSDLLSSNLSGERLMKFHKDIGSVSGKDKALSILKKPVKEAISSISPKLRNDFEMVNKLYTKYYPINKILKPDIASKLYSAGESLGLAFAVITGNPFLLKGILSEHAIRKLSQQLLLNPRFQQLGKKTAIALNENKSATAKKLIDAISYQLKGIDTESSKKLKELSKEEIDSFLNPS